MNILQNLDLTTGDKSRCIAGYPHKQMVVIECIKDFDTAINTDDIINNPYDYINVITGQLLTSHLISSNWQ